MRDHRRFLMQRGSKMTLESRVKISKAKKGKSLTHQHRQKISIAKKLYWHNIHELIDANKKFFATSLIQAQTPVEDQPAGEPRGNISFVQRP
jgi:hypothetical protein